MDRRWILACASCATAAAVLVSPARALVSVADVVLHGDANAIQMRDGHLFIATDAGLEILDVANPKGPVPRGFLATPSAVSGLVLDGDLAYLACVGGLRIADVSDLAAPVPRGSVDTSVSFDVALAADHAHAYLATVDALRIVDVSDPDAPAEIGSLADPKPRRLARIGDSLFGTLGYAGVAVLDVSDPAAPVPLPSIGPLAPPDPYGLPETIDVRAEGDRLWVFDVSQYGDSVLRLFDVTTPATPLLLDTVYLGVFAAQDVSIAGDFVFTARCFSVSGCAVAQIDISQRTAPKLVAAHALTSFSIDPHVVALGNYAFLADGPRLRVVDFSQPEWPRALDSIGFLDPDPNSSHSVEHIERIGSLAYVAAAGAGLRIVDVSDPEALVEVGFHDFNLRVAQDLAVEPPIALVSDTVGIRVATVADPAHPYVIADPHVPTYDVELVGGVGYSASGTDGLVIWDLSEPANPQILGSAPVTDARDMALADGRAYLVGATAPIRPYEPGPFELVVVDVVDLAQPAERGRLALGESLFDVDVEVMGSIAYVALDSEVHIVDVSDPDAPLSLGSFRTCGYGGEIEIRGSRLFAAATACGLDVFDLANPVQPRELGIAPPPLESGRSVEAAGRIVYLGTSWGLVTFDLGPEYAPEPGALASAGVALAALAGAARRRGTACR